MKDNFSSQSKQYLKFRPTYPDELYQFLLSLLQEKDTAWDCGTGNGQVAQELAKQLKEVFATDISENQIANAIKKENIVYKVESAERTSFPGNYFDLVTVAQAIHWFDFEEFYREVKRIIKPDGILAVIGYGLLKVDAATDEVINHFYYEVVGRYWDKERKYIDEEYKTIPFPFHEIDAPVFYIRSEWTFEHLIGYFETWSALQHYIKTNKQNPIDQIYQEMRKVWKENETKSVRFPVLLRIGKG